MALRSHPTARQERLGAELRKMREAAGMTAREAADRVGTTAAQMSHMEAGRTGVSEERLRRMAAEYACFDGALIDELVAMATDRGKGWWEKYRGVLPHAALDLAELEHHAAYLRMFEAAYVPGLLQTEAYVRALFAYGLSESSPQDLAPRVSFRLQRRDVLDRDPVLPWEVLIHEAALRTRVADRKVQREQLAFILERSDHPHVTVRVVPFDVDGFGGAGNSMLYVGGPVPELDTVRLDASWPAPLQIDAKSQLVRYRLLLDKVVRFSLSAGESRDFIRRVAQEI
ncbi:helix-turn-helix transcriptional regulator [Streptomyces sp. B1866]|uniref:helix-turn-helix domain-containing protein n=1 Tax=Streptomyces sp. B1866 TaxID=3075431 RepID=UPI00288C9467|nr:helix-turn-helix transcriptional regulator [Streptomyces sp. B1866]MDT3395839.1 helix-turn-helix transcriptional regulator [Streptomyces sp. B1866]